MGAGGKDLKGIYFKILFTLASRSPENWYCSLRCFSCSFRANSLFKVFAEHLDFQPIQMDKSDHCFIFKVAFRAGVEVQEKLYSSSHYLSKPNLVILRNASNKLKYFRRHLKTPMDYTVNMWSGLLSHLSSGALSPGRQSV